MNATGLELPEVPVEIPTVHFSVAQEMIEAASGNRVIGEPDLSPSDERWIGQWALREHGSDFVFVVGYPTAKRPFYTHPDPERPGFSNSFRPALSCMELVTGGQRLHRYDDYLDALSGTDRAPLDGYLAAFRHGMPPHGGFAIGLRALGGSHRGSGERPRSHALPLRSYAIDPVNGGCSTRTRKRRVLAMTRPGPSAEARPARREISTFGGSLFHSEPKPYRLLNRGIDMVGAVDLKLADESQWGLCDEAGRLAMMRLSGMHQEWVAEVDVSR